MLHICSLAVTELPCCCLWCAQVDIQTALRSNYLGTQEVLQLASACKQLKGLVHTSSCFVNMNQPRSSVVQERIYPLKFGDRCVGHAVDSIAMQHCKLPFLLLADDAWSKCMIAPVTHVTLLLPAAIATCVY